MPKGLKKLKRILPAVGLVTLLLGGAFYLFRKSEPIGEAQHAHLVETARRLYQLEAQLKHSALQARQGSSHQYDNLLIVSQQMLSVTGSLNQALIWGEPARSKMKQSILQTENVVRQQIAASERFKSHNSLLKNSLRYLPVAINQLNKDLESIEQAEELKILNQQFLEDTLLYNLFYDHQYLVSLEGTLSKLLPLIRTLPKQQQKRYRIVHSHAEICVRELRNIGQVLERLDNAQIRPSLSRLLAQNQEQTQEYNLHASFRRNLLYGLSVIIFLLLVAAAVKLAQTYNTLEERIADRTRDLESSNERVLKLYQENRLVLDSAQEGMVIIDFHGNYQSDPSSKFKEIFSSHAESESFLDSLREVDDGAASWLDMGLNSLAMGLFSFEVAEAQFPTEMKIEEKTYTIKYLPVGAEEQLERILVILTDITAELESKKAQSRQQQVIRVFKALKENKAGLNEFWRETTKNIEELSKIDREDELLAKRLLHTLKGNASLYGLIDLVDTCHELESSLTEFDLAEVHDEIVYQLNEVWSQTNIQLAWILQDAQDNKILIDPFDLDQLIMDIYQGLSEDDIIHNLNGWSMESANKRLELLVNQAQTLGQRIGRNNIKFEFFDSGERLESERWAPFWSSFSHAIRNAIDHGVESEEERLSTGKTPQATITLRTHYNSEQYVVSMHDDGRGINWEKVRGKAADLGLAYQSHEDLVAALFSSGLSTQEEAGELSGRGVGMAALRQACEDLGGTLEVDSQTGVGTHLRFIFPDPLDLIHFRSSPVINAAPVNEIF